MGGIIWTELGRDGVAGLVNYGDRRYEACAEKAKSCEQIINTGNSLIVPAPFGKVMILKGEEVPTADGDLLVMGTREGIHLKAGRSLEDTMKEAKDNEGVIIVTTPYSGVKRSNVGNRLKENPKLMEYVDAVEVHNGEARERTNRKSSELYEWIKNSRHLEIIPECSNVKLTDWIMSYHNIGAISSSDGHSYHEVGRSHTIIRIPQLEELKTAKQVTDAIREGVREAGVNNHDCQKSTIGAVTHASIVAYIILADKLGIKVIRGDQEALRQWFLHIFSCWIFSKSQITSNI